ncbi:hypothetical protein FXO38_30634 [Capsicum annuum]|nr:hypothetical protein FXO37_35824 [Capsicum annuum]KAF3623671.1 hypothetical protein FXO38_30634 [Capsicum annuum]
MEEIKDWLKIIEKGLLTLQESTSRLMQLSKDTNTDMEIVCLRSNRLKQDDVKLFNRLFSKVNSIKSEANSSNNELVISVQNFYSGFFECVEKSYEYFCHNMHNTFPYFLAKH